MTTERCYFSKFRNGLWEVWCCHADGSADEHSKINEWEASTLRFFWRSSADRMANDLLAAYNAGFRSKEFDIWLSEAKKKVTKL